MSTPTALELEEFRQDLLENDYNTTEHDRLMRSDFHYFIQHTPEFLTAKQSIRRIREQCHHYDWSSTLVLDLLITHEGDTC